MIGRIVPLEKFKAAIAAAEWPQTKKEWFLGSVRVARLLAYLGVGVYWFLFLAHVVVPDLALYVEARKESMGLLYPFWGVALALSIVMLAWVYLGEFMRNDRRERD